MTIVVGAAVTDAATDAQVIAKVVEKSVKVEVVLLGVIARLLAPMQNSKPMGFPAGKQAPHARPALPGLRVSPGHPKLRAHLVHLGLLVLHRARKEQASFAWC